MSPQNPQNQNKSREVTASSLAAPPLHVGENFMTMLKWISLVFGVLAPFPFLVIISLLFLPIAVGYFKGIPNNASGASVVFLVYSIWISAGWFGLISLGRIIYRDFFIKRLDAIGILVGLLAAIGFLYEGNFYWKDGKLEGWYDLLPMILVFPILIAVLLMFKLAYDVIRRVPTSRWS